MHSAECTQNITKCKNNKRFGFTCACGTEYSSLFFFLLLSPWLSNRLYFYFRYEFNFNFNTFLMIHDSMFHISLYTINTFLSTFVLMLFFHFISLELLFVSLLLYIFPLLLFSNVWNIMPQVNYDLFLICLFSIHSPLLLLLLYGFVRIRELLFDIKDHTFTQFHWWSN